MNDGKIMISPEDLTEEQLDNLADFLKKHEWSWSPTHEGYVKGISDGHYFSAIPDVFLYPGGYDGKFDDINPEDLKEILKSFIQWLSTIEYPSKNAAAGAVDLFISILSEDLYSKYDKAISRGQAEAVIRRVLNIKLDSKGRSQLHELRKKIQKYKRLIMNFEEYDKLDEYLFKIVFMGPSTEERIKLIHKYADNVEEINRLPTLGVDVSTKKIQVKNNLIKLILVDTSEQEFFGKVRPNYYRGASGGIITFDKCDRKSFKLIEHYYNEFKQSTQLKYELQEEKGTFIDVPLVVLGFIGDSEVVTKEEGRKLAQKLGTTYYEMKNTDTHHFAELNTSLAYEILTRISGVRPSVLV